MSATPQRIQLRRTKGWNLQQESLALNGLPAVKVTRPGPWGNMFPLSGFSREEAIRRFRIVAEQTARLDPSWLDPLRGKNLACACKPGTVCHADVLLELANQ